jgi:hypothetical protein
MVKVKRKLALYVQYFPAKSTPNPHLLKGSCEEIGWKEAKAFVAPSPGIRMHQIFSRLILFTASGRAGWISGRAVGQEKIMADGFRHTNILIFVKINIFDVFKIKY